MTVEEICKFPLPPMEPDAHLFLWRCASMQREALDVIDAWGFRLKSEIVWLKKTSSGKRWFGMGRTVRAEHETCLIATRGRPQVLSRSVRSVFEAPVGRHSAKPAEFFSIVEQLCSGPYVELFARQQRPGWTALGLEADGDGDVSENKEHLTYDQRSRRLGNRAGNAFVACRRRRWPRTWRSP
jgi:N6-adenosine-specific RNA methylase IME4